MKVDSVETVSDAASSFEIYSLWGAPLMHALPLIALVCFSLRNRSEEERAFNHSSLLSLDASITVQVSITCSWVSSLIAAFSPLAPNFLNPCLRLYWVITYPQTFSSSSKLVINAGSITCTVSSTQGSRSEMLFQVVVCICSSFDICMYRAHSITLLHALVLPS
jgi:hypothetical protein